MCKFEICTYICNSIRLNVFLQFHMTLLLLFYRVILVLWSCQYLLPLKTDHPAVVHVSDDLGGPLDQYDPFRQ